MIVAEMGKVLSEAKEEVEGAADKVSGWRVRRPYTSPTNVYQGVRRRLLLNSESTIDDLLKPSPRLHASLEFTSRQHTRKDEFIDQIVAANAVEIVGEADGAQVRLGLVISDRGRGQMPPFSLSKMGAVSLRLLRSEANASSHGEGWPFLTSHPRVGDLAISPVVIETSNSFSLALETPRAR